jgi:predicted GIY-YIG superfamily endonuclease/ribonuclease HI
MQEWFVYIVKCADKTFYTGITIDLKRRVHEHNGNDKKGARYTKTRRPVKLVYSETANSRSEAIKRELAIKQLGRLAKIKLIKSKKKTGSRMKKMSLFTDGSLNTKLEIGFGSYLFIPNNELADAATEKLKLQIKTKKFKCTSSVTLEIETLLSALEEIKNTDAGALTVYTDSQCITGLKSRRERLEKTDFKSAGKGKTLNNALLYKKYFKAYDRFKFEVVKVKGHSKAGGMDNIHKIFSIVDRAPRASLRDELLKNRNCQKFYENL